MRYYYSRWRVAALWANSLAVEDMAGVIMVAWITGVLAVWITGGLVVWMMAGTVAWVTEDLVVWVMMIEFASGFHGDNPGVQALIFKM
uniref:Uncharacterized protein n=1 Tax=mine drainage metagenome TaxID=410659 RepID=E6QRK0_9ZZZZ